jgi:hypothetical protein
MVLAPDDRVEDVAHPPAIQVGERTTRRGGHTEALPAIVQRVQEIDAARERVDRPGTLHPAGDQLADDAADHPLEVGKVGRQELAE